jgi:hypothetical protein
MSESTSYSAITSQAAALIKIREYLEKLNDFNLLLKDIVTVFTPNIKGLV